MTSRPTVSESNRRRAIDPATRVERQPDGCWLWTGALNSAGYGHFAREGLGVVAHRWFYEQANGPIPAGLVLDHVCRTPRCVNPAHLEAVTNAENCRRGSNTRVTREVAASIQAEYRPYSRTASARALGAKYGISEVHAFRIAKGDRWSDEPLERVGELDAPRKQRDYARRR